MIRAAEVRNKLSISTGTPKFIAGRGAGWLYWGAPVGLSSKFGLDSHTGAPKTPVPKNVYFKIARFY
jgi:hypothetical protein